MDFFDPNSPTFVAEMISLFVGALLLWPYATIVSCDGIVDFRPPYKVVLIAVLLDYGFSLFWSNQIYMAHSRAGQSVSLYWWVLVFISSAIFFAYMIGKIVKHPIEGPVGFKNGVKIYLLSLPIALVLFVAGTLILVPVIFGFWFVLDFLT